MEDVRVRALIYRAIAAFAALSGLVMIAIAVRGPTSFPERSSLIEQSGTVAWVAPSKYGLRFALEGDPRTYGYEKKSGDLRAIQAALNDSKHQPITVLIDEAPIGSGDSSVFQVLELRTRETMLRTLHDVQRSWGQDYKLGYLVALCLLTAAWFLAYQAGKLARQNQDAGPFRHKG